MRGQHLCTSLGFGCIPGGGPGLGAVLPVSPSTTGPRPLPQTLSHSGAGQKSWGVLKIGRAKHAGKSPRSSPDGLGAAAGARKQQDARRSLSLLSVDWGDHTASQDTETVLGHVLKPFPEASTHPSAGTAKPVSGPPRVPRELAVQMLDKLGALSKRLCGVGLVAGAGGTQGPATRQVL